MPDAARGPSHPPLQSRLPYKWVALIIASIAAFSSTADASMVVISLPALGDALDASTSTVIWVVAAYLLTSVGLVLGMGRLNDALGSRRVINLGFLVFTIGLALSAFAQTVIYLVLFRVVAAVGGAMLLSSYVAIAVDAFPAKERGRAMGILSAVTAGGLAMGPLIGGVLLDSLGWRSTFYLRVPLSAVGLALGLLFVQDTRPSIGPIRFDYAGAITVFVGLVAMAFATNQATAWGLTSAPFLSLILFGAFMLVLFVRVERRAAQPIIDLSQFRDRVYASGSLSMLLYFVGVGTAYFLLPFFLIQGKGYSSTVAGLLFALLPFSMGVLSPLAGLLSDRVGSRWPTALGVSVSAVTLVAMAALGENTGIWIVALVLVLHGFGSGLFEAPNISAIMGSVASDRLGLASASIAISRQIGLILAIVLGGAIYAARRDAYGSTLAAPGAVIEGFQDAVLVMASAAALGAIVAAFRGRDR